VVSAKVVAMGSLLGGGACDTTDPEERT